MELRALFFFTASLLPPSSILSAVVHSSSAGGGDLGFCTNHQQGAGHHHQQDRMAALGGVQDPRGTENHTSVKDFARFAIDEHNKKDGRLETAGEQLATLLMTGIGNLVKDGELLEQVDGEGGLS
ncbi:uncharacterized protein LOC116205636 [Punica granatum]|uniref:Uncharacterized protein LOC116205636 n=1 Tax=Punica granatum TaxID=22663 RepID=A0A6P8DI37_PUNGR|nr:uncharacterized protein LOC116205636 [Punica granatum]